MACLGVTSKDCFALGMAAMEGFNFEVARKAFIRTRDFKYLNLIALFQDLRRQSSVKNEVFLGYLFAYQSKFNEAAKSFRRVGEENLALQMFTDLRMFEMAKEYLSGSGIADSNNILLKQAEWAIRNGDQKTAAELYISSKQFNKAIELAGKNDWAEMLLEIVRKLDKADRDALAKCGEHFKRLGLHNFAAEVYEKMGNIRELIELRMESHQWEEVFALARKYPDLDKLAHYKYGQWLAESDQFEEAQKGWLSLFSSFYLKKQK